MAKLRWAFVASIAAVALVIASYTQSWYKIERTPDDSTLGPQHLVTKFYWKKSTTTNDDGDKTVSAQFSGAIINGKGFNLQRKRLY